jgi:hypothetical protein
LTAVLLLTFVLATRFVSPALAAAPANDAIANASELGYPDSAVSSTLEATVGPEDGNGCGGGPSIWYRFTGLGAEIQANTYGSDFDSYLTVFSGPADALSFIGCNDDTSGLQSAVTFFAESGVSYYLMVNGCCGSSGNVVISTAVPPIPFSFELAIDTTTVNAKEGVVTIGGSVTCTTEGYFLIALETSQRAGRAILLGDSYDELTCDGSGPVSWSMQFGAANGLFKGGKATISGYAFGSGFEGGAGSWEFSIEPTEVRLTGRR